MGYRRSTVGCRGSTVGCRVSTASSGVGCMHQRLLALPDLDDGVDGADRADDTVDEVAVGRSELHRRFELRRVLSIPNSFSRYRYLTTY